MHDLLELTRDDAQRKRVTLFDTLLTDTTLYKKLQLTCDTLRKKYLARINKSVRKIINEIYVFDQVAKAVNTDRKKMTTQPNFTYPENKFASVYDSLIRTVGFPGERIVGFDDTGVAISLGMPEYELRAIFDRHYRRLPNIGGVREYGVHVYKDFSAHTSLVPFRENSCSYRNFQPYMLDQIMKGNIHPAEASSLLWTPYYALKRGACQYDEELIPYNWILKDSVNTVKAVESSKKRAKIFMLPWDIYPAVDSFRVRYQVAIL